MITMKQRMVLPETDKKPKRAFKLLWNGLQGPYVNEGRISNRAYKRGLRQMRKKARKAKGK